MDIPHNLTNLFWASVIAGVLAILCIAVGLTFLLGRLQVRRIGLRLVWISSAMLVASIITMVMVLTAR